LEFEQMMTDAESEIYQKCFSSLNDFQKRRKNSKGFAIAMRAAFEKIIDGESK